MSKDDRRAPKVYWDCCTHCTCKVKGKDTHTIPCSRCQDID